MKFTSLIITVLLAVSSVFAADPTSGQWLFQKKNAGAGFSNFGVTGENNKAFGIDGSGAPSMLTTGTVSSVGLSMPSSTFDVASSPVTESGTIAVTFDNQTGNVVFASPSNGSSGQPLWRTLVVADIPSLTSLYATAAQGTKADNAGAVNGIIKSNGSALFSAAVAGTDYVVPSGSITGNAATATALQTARTINGVSFDGTGNITVTAAAGTLTGTTLNSTVVNTSITSTGTLTGGATGAGFTVALGTSTITGTLAVANGGTGATSLANLIALSTDTTGNYVATLAGTTNRTTVSGSGSEGASVTVDISTAYAGQATITTLGTVATGTWNATNIALAKGGTGVSLSNPGATRILGWDNGSGLVGWFGEGTGIDLLGTSISVDTSLVMMKSVYDPQGAGFISGASGAAAAPNSGGTGGSLQFSGGAANAVGGNGGNGGTILMLGGNASEVEAGANAGSITTSASAGSGGGSIDTSGGASGIGGSINTSNNGGGVTTNDGGGNIATHSGGGGINTSNGGGAIDTTGLGSMEFGVSGTRTTITGQATSDQSIQWPDASGTVTLNSNTATLTNKSISGPSNTDTALPTSSLNDDAVTNAKMAHMAQATIKGRATGAGTGDPTDLTADQAMALLATATSAPITTATMKVRQVVVVSPKTDTATGTNTPPTWAVAYSGTITTTAADSKVIAVCMTNTGATSGYYVFLRLQRNGTPLTQGDAAGNRVQCMTAAFPPNSAAMVGTTLVGSDTPGSAGAHQYDLAITLNPGSGAAWYLNRSLSDDDLNERPRAATTMVLIEVAP